MIEPVLTAEEWAEFTWDLSNHSRGADGYDWQDGEDARIWANNGQDILYLVDRNARETEEQERCVRVKGISQRLALAAMCLHGRITWEMVDAIRYVLENASFWDEGPQGQGWPSRTMSASTSTLSEIADLLESLLPPREKP